MKICNEADKLRTKCANALTSHRMQAHGQPIGYSREDLERLAQATSTCPYCQKPVGIDGQFDLKTPAERGGAYVLANLVFCCGLCRRVKGNLTATEFAYFLRALARLDPVAAEDIQRRLAGGTRHYGGR
jgi:5-methylcytosine-specific restriction endonuclease McrA